MIYTEKAEAALLLGADMARCPWDAFAGRYVATREIMVERTALLELDDIEFPASHSEYQQQHAALLQDVFQSLGEQRKFLGVDGYAFPFFALSYALYIVIASLVGGESIGDEAFGLLSSALLDINIQGDGSQVEALIQSEVNQLKADDSESTDVAREPDVFLAWARVTHQIMERWLEVERRTGQDMPAIGLKDEPLHSCFISYSHHDESFCAQLCETLKLNGVNVWMAPDRLMAGAHLTKSIDAALAKYDKMILVLTENSMKSDWVPYEIKTAMNVGAFRSMDVLIPVYLGTKQLIDQWQLTDVETGIDLADQIRQHLYADFTNWEDPRSFDFSYELVKRALRQLRTEE